MLGPYSNNAGTLVCWVYWTTFEGVLGDHQAKFGGQTILGKEVQGTPGIVQQTQPPNISKQFQASQG